MRPTPVPPLGCYFLRDVVLAGSGYLFANRYFVREHAHTSDVALEWLNDPGFPDNPLRQADYTTTVVEDPTLIVFGAGHLIFGHWLLDFLPRVLIARATLGPSFGEYVIPLPSDTPDWVASMMGYFCGVPREQIRKFDRYSERLICRNACIPTFAHNGEYAIHPFLREAYDRVGPQDLPPIARRLCISRKAFEGRTDSAWRIFESRAMFEETAIRFGYDIVRPEELPFSGQVVLFRSATCIVGEHGSGMHSAVFARPGTIVATFPPLNAVQYRIGAAFEHRNVWISQFNVTDNGRGRAYRFKLSEDTIRGLFAVLEVLQRTRLTALYTR